MLDVVLVDTSHLLYRSAHTFKALENKAKQPTGIHFGIMRSIEHLKKQCPNSYLIFVLDGTGIHRREIYPQYKANRGGDHASHFEIVHEFGLKMDVMDLVKACGCAVVHHQDYECDDLIAMLAAWSGGYLPIDPINGKVVVYSGDDDFCQLVNTKVSILKPPAGKGQPERWMDPKQVFKEWGVKPESMALYRSFLGDDGDNIPRLPRVNRARLQMAVAGKTVPSQFYEGDGLAYFTPDWQRKLTDFKSQCELNYRLTRLPWAFEERVAIEYLECGLDISKLASILEKLEFTSFMKKIGALEELFGPTSYAKAVSAFSNRSEHRPDSASGLEGAASGPGLAPPGAAAGETKEVS